MNGFQGSGSQLWELYSPGDVGDEVLLIVTSGRQGCAAPGSREQNQRCRRITYRVLDCFPPQQIIWCKMSVGPVLGTLGYS